MFLGETESTFLLPADDDKHDLSRGFDGRGVCSGVLAPLLPSLPGTNNMRKIVKRLGKDWSFFSLLLISRADESRRGRANAAAESLRFSLVLRSCSDICAVPCSRVASSVA